MKHVATSNLEAQLFGLSTLVQLGKRARHAAVRTEPLSIEMEWRAPAPGSQVRQIADILRDQPPPVRHR